MPGRKRTSVSEHILVQVQVGPNSVQKPVSCLTTSSINVGAEHDIVQFVFMFLQKALLIIAAPVAAVNAQWGSSVSTTATSPAPSPATGISPCVLQCITTVAAQNGCTGITDLACLCTKPQFQADVADCVRRLCHGAAADQATALQLQSSQCAAAGLTPTSAMPDSCHVPPTIHYVTMTHTGDVTSSCGTPSVIQSATITTIQIDPQPSKAVDTPVAATPSTSKGADTPSASQAVATPSISKGADTPPASKGTDTPTASKGTNTPIASKGSGTGLWTSTGTFLGGVLAAVLAF